jgi:hypothetical protein
MADMYSLDLLPQKYRVFKSIVSVENRLGLCETTVSITNLLKDLHGFTADPAIVKLVDRYFTYLDRSCLSFEVLNKRALWLRNYGQILEHRLKLAVAQTMKKPTVQSPVTDRHFLDKLEVLTHAIAQYRLNTVGHDPQWDNDAIAILGKITDLAMRLTPNHDHRSYQALIIMIDRLIDHLQQRSPRLHVQDTGFNILMRLLELHYIVSQYTVF